MSTAAIGHGIATVLILTNKPCMYINVKETTAFISFSGKLRASIRKKKKKSPPPIPNFSGNGALQTSPGEEQEAVVGDSHVSVM